MITLMALTVVQYDVCGLRYELGGYKFLCEPVVIFLLGEKGWQRTKIQLLAQLLIKSSYL